ncbi:hypothetical protein LZ30DRAFT_798857 [Colletotrichum cereale]|nr:hypothetical protein LZ30DRAFT_798857 [Colletotrichum cereale]
MRTSAGTQITDHGCCLGEPTLIHTDTHQPTWLVEPGGFCSSWDKATGPYLLESCLTRLSVWVKPRNLRLFTGRGTAARRCHRRRRDARVHPLWSGSLGDSAQATDASGWHHREAYIVRSTSMVSWEEVQMPSPSLAPYNSILAVSPLELANFEHHQDALFPFTQPHEVNEVLSRVELYRVRLPQTGSRTIDQSKSCLITTPNTPTRLVCVF